MAEFELNNKAVEDLAKIWDYTYYVWSESQGDKYYEMLISNSQEIAANPDLGKSYDGITQSLPGTKANRHIIFYLIINENCAKNTRNLDEKMDFKKEIF